MVSKAVKIEINKFIQKIQKKISISIINKSEEELYISALRQITSAFIGHCEDLKEFHDINGKDKQEWEESLDKVMYVRELLVKALDKEPYGINGRINMLFVNQEDLSVSI